jgi:hypothetical protein
MSPPYVVEVQDIAGVWHRRLEMRLEDRADFHAHAFANQGYPSRVTDDATPGAPPLIEYLPIDRGAA